MITNRLTNDEIAMRLAQAARAWRIEPAGAALSQADAAKRAGIGLTPLKRFEKTGAITLANFIALMRALGLVERLGDLIPNPDEPNPIDLLEQERRQMVRRRAPRKLAGARPVKHE
jgi:hypothetical protein